MVTVNCPNLKESTAMKGKLALTVVLALAAGAASAQQWPTKPVRFVAPFAPGGGTDFIARIAAQKLTEAIKQQVIVENRPGAGGTLGAEVGAKAPPDGYTFTVIAGSYAVNPGLYKLAFDPVNDITAVIQFSQGPLAHRRPIPRCRRRMRRS